MSSARRFFGVNLAVAAIGAFATLLALAVAVRGTSVKAPTTASIVFACRRLGIPDLGAGGAAVLLLASLGLVVLALAGHALVRQLRAHRRFMRALSPAGRTRVGGSRVDLIEAERAQAFCAGFVRPRIYVSTGAIALLSDAQLRAVVAHERHHQRLRDPLRLLIARACSGALFFMPALRPLADRYAALAEVAADEAAVRGHGRQTMASALLAFGESGNPAVVAGIAPERVEHLLGEGPRWHLPLSLVLGSLVAAGGLIGLSVTAATATAGGRLNLPMLASQSCMAAMAGMALLALAGLLGLSRPLRRRHPIR